MLTRLTSAWENVRDSLWGLPLAIATVCAGLLILFLNLDLPWTSDVAWLYAGDASQAPEFAASLVSAMITVTALAFSITMVVLTLAAQQLGPRLISIFMSDRKVQAILGLFLGTVIYLLLLLRFLDGEAAPSLPISGGTMLVLSSMIALLFFVHNLASSIVSDHVIARVGADIDAGISAAFPEAPVPDISPPQRGAELRLEKGGYLQRIDYDLLARAASRNGAVITLAYRPGATILPGEVHAWTTSPSGWADLATPFRRAIVISDVRSPAQEPEYAVRQMVEVALRALSPGINDEFTALEAIDRLGRALALAIRRAEPRTSWTDDEQVVRVHGPAPTFATILDASFDQIRAASTGKHRVLLRLADNLRRLAAIADVPRRPHLLRHVDELDSLAQSTLISAADRASVAGVVYEARENLGVADEPGRQTPGLQRRRGQPQRSKAEKSSPTA